MRGCLTAYYPEEIEDMIRRFRIPLLCLAFGVFLACEGVDTPPKPDVTGPYLGQDPPGAVPELFAPGILSTAWVEWSPSTAPDGLELFFTLRGLDALHLVTTRQESGRWTDLELVSFTSGHDEADPFLSPDGNNLFFWSNRPIRPGGATELDGDLWMVSRKGDGWGEPQPLPEAINTDTWQVYPSVASDLTLYFAAYYEEGGVGHFDLWRSDWVDGGYGTPVNLGPSVNSENLDQEPAISPDGNTLVFVSTRHGRDDWDLYVSFRLPNGSWTEAVNLGEGFNTEDTDQAPVFSADGRFLFFSSNRRWTPEDRDGAALTYRSVIEALGSPGNGNSDVYWASTTALQRFRPPPA